MAGWIDGWKFEMSERGIINDEGEESYMQWNQAV